MKNNNTLLIILVIIFFVVCCLCLVLLVSGSLLTINAIENFNSNFQLAPFVVTTEIPPSGRETLPNNQYLVPENDNNFPTDNPDKLQDSYETISILKNTYVPENDPRDLARRLNGVNNIPETYPIRQEYKVGDRKEFWATNVDTNENRRVQALLGFKTENIYFWIEDGVEYDEKELDLLVTTFEEDILPTNREFFGTEWIPGIDEDERLYVLLANNLGSGLAGYFSSSDALPPQIHQYSNAHEMFMLNADNIRLNQKFTYGVLAHEYQHMIHWYRDRNETSWLNEGFSELAAFLNGYYESGFDSFYLNNTDVQLNDWPNSPNNTTPHYGSSFLFVNYFLNRFGEDATKLLVQNSTNGMDSIDEVLRQIEAIDLLSNQPITSNDLFSDWIVTNLLQDKKVGDGRYQYENFKRVQKASVTEKFNECSFDWNERSVAQYGVDYIEFKCNDNFTLHFKGDTITNVIPESSYSGDYSFWSNKGDESQMVLSRTFNFSNVHEPITMTFMAWFDIEVDYDYLYLTASTDGDNWEILETPNCTNNDPTGNSYGCGFNGNSNGWIKQHVDLSTYAGDIVELRFEYVTDAAVNGEGFLLDDIQIPVIDYYADFETDEGGWIPEGWARINNLLPQTYELILVEFNSGKVNIQRIDLPINQEIIIPLNGKINSKTYLIVSGTTRYTRQSANYMLKLFQ